MKTLVLSSLLIAFASLIAYIIAIIKVHGIRKSISDSNYFLRKPFKLMFELVMWICGIAIILTGTFIKATPEWIIIAGGIGIFLVGIFSDFKRHILIKIAHFTSAIGGFAILGLSYYFSFDNFTYTIIVAISALAASVFADKRLWALEITMSVEIFAGLFFYAYSIM